jgi:hypothetical protein
MRIVRAEAPDLHRIMTAAGTVGVRLCFANDWLSVTFARTHSSSSGFRHRQPDVHLRHQ